MNRWRRRSAVWMILFLLAGCRVREDEELRTWMSKIRSEAAPVPLPEPGTPAIRALVYDASGHADPFDTTKIAAVASTSTFTGNGPQPDPRRPREPLESYPLDSLRMVGSLLQRGQAVALVQADKVLYQVRKGHHLGQDQGKVIHISDAAIDIEEMVQESVGTWTTRKVQLSIQDGK